MKQEEKALKLYNGVTGIGDDLIEEAGAVQAQERKKSRPWRWGLVAACLCAALLGTAAAAQFSGVWVVKGMREDMRGIEMGGGMAYFPLDGLSEEIRALEGANTIKSFQSWEEIEAFIGMDLMDNPVLVHSPEDYFRFELNGVRGNFFLRVAESLEFIDVMGCYEVGDVVIDVRAFLCTERTTDREDWNEQFSGVYYPRRPEMETEIETYTSSSGLETQIVHLKDKDWERYMAAFSIHGIPFELTLHGGNMGTCRAVLIQVLDSFEL